MTTCRTTAPFYTMFKQFNFYSNPISHLPSMAPGPSFGPGSVATLPSPGALLRGLSQSLSARAAAHAADGRCTAGGAFEAFGGGAATAGGAGAAGAAGDEGGWMGVGI